MSNTSELKWLCIGLGLGAVTALLFAPKSGAETRQVLKDRTLEGADYVKSQAAGVVDTAADAVQRGTKTLQYQKDNLVSAVEAGRSAYTEALASTPSL